MKAKFEFQLHQKFSKLQQTNCLSLTFLICKNNGYPSASYKALLWEFTEIVNIHLTQLIIVVNSKKPGSSSQKCRDTVCT